MPAPVSELSVDSCSLLRTASLPRKQGNVLLVRNPALPWPESHCLERNQQSFDQAIHLSQGLGKERYSGLSCRSDELPFVEASFRLVVLWHIVADGQEAELAEASRVLAPGGDLLVLGQQRHFLARWSQGKAQNLPVLNRHSLRRNLLELGLEVDSVTGSGLPFNRGWTVRQAGLAGMLLPFASLVLVQARHGNPETPGLLSLGSFRSEVARPTEAASLFFTTNRRKTSND